MFKKLILTAGVVLGLCSNSVFSNPPMIKLGQANGIEYILKPGESQTMTNFYPWTLNANCKMTCEEDEINTIEFKILKKTGALNGIPLNTGDSMSIDIHPKDELVITANTGSKVELKNIGKTTIRADCNVVN